MKKNIAMLSSFITAASLTACMGLCSCSAPTNSVNANDLVASFVTGESETTVTTGITDDAKVKFLDANDVGSGRTRFEDCDDCEITVTTPPAESDEQEEATDTTEETQPVYYVEESVEEEVEYVEESTSVDDAPASVGAPDNSAPAEEAAPEPSSPAPAASAPASNPAPAASAPAATTSTPAASAPVVSTPAPAPRQLSEEEQLAREIFNKYNDFRASRGLNRVSWSDRCASMATSSASGCASQRKLVHRLGIPSNLQGSYSDILQYASWKLSGSEAVTNWINSSGHRQQMQCGSATEAGVGVVRGADGYWYVALVYNFSGSNRG